MKPKLTCYRPKCNNPVFQDGLCYKHLCNKRQGIAKKNGTFIKVRFTPKELKQLQSDKIACLNSNLGNDSSPKLGADGQWNHGNNK